MKLLNALEAQARDWQRMLESHYSGDARLPPKSVATLEHNVAMTDAMLAEREHFYDPIN